MINLDIEIPIYPEILKYLLKKIYYNTNDIIDFNVNIEEYDDPSNIYNMIMRFYIDSTQLYKELNKIISYREVLYLNDNNINNYDYKDIKKSLDYLIAENLLYVIEVSNTINYNIDNKKILINPHGILSYSLLKKIDKNEYIDQQINEIINIASEKLGDYYNSYIFKRIIDSMDQLGGTLNEKEIIFTIYLILSQNISQQRTLKLSKPVQNELIIPLNKISKLLLNKEVFNINIDNWIRRTTQSGSLKAKLINKYNKKNSINGDNYIIYLNLQKNELEKTLKKITSDIMKNNGHKSLINFKKLVQECLSDISIIYDDKLEIFYQIQNKRPTTLYLTRLNNIIKKINS